MKILLYTHVADCDGATPAILLKMVEKDVDVIYLDNAEVDPAINEGVESGLCDKYDQIYITDISPNKEILDKMDYDGSMIYDEYPDKMRLYSLAQDILNQIKRENGEEDMQDMDSDKWGQLGELIQILLFYEIYKRRHRNRRGILKF